MAICPIIVHFNTWRARSMHDVAREFARAAVRSKDAQKQLARTSLNEKLTFDQSNKSLHSIKVSNLIIGGEFFACWPDHLFPSHFPFW